MTFLLRLNHAANNSATIQPTVLSWLPGVNITWTVETCNNISIISNINVDSKGKITATYGLDDEVVIGSFALASFSNDPGLKSVGSNRYQNNAKSGEANFGIGMEKGFGRIEFYDNQIRWFFDLTQE